MSDQAIAPTKTCTQCVVSFTASGESIYAKLVRRGEFWCCEVCDASYGTSPHPDLREQVVSYARENSYFSGPVWNWFELSRTSHLVLTRVLLCSMPYEWQEKFVTLMREAEQRMPEEYQGGDYWVRRREGNRFVHDPLTDYRHPPNIVLREPVPE